MLDEDTVDKEGTIKGKGSARRWRQSPCYCQRKITEIWGHSAIEQRVVPRQFFKSDKTQQEANKSKKVQAE